MNEERARQGVEHLQSAAIEVISALRALLDVVEDLVRDPATAVTIATSASTVVTAAAGFASTLLDAGRAATAGSTTGESPDPRVTRIRVS